VPPSRKQNQNAKRTVLNLQTQKRTEYAGMTECNPSSGRCRDLLNSGICPTVKPEIQSNY